MLIIQETTQKAKYPIEPLIDYLRSLGFDSYLEMSNRCGYDYNYLQKTTSVSDKVADRIATTLGVHPVLIWGDDYWEWLDHTLEVKQKQVDRRKRLKLASQKKRREAGKVS